MKNRYKKNMKKIIVFFIIIILITSMIESKNDEKIKTNYESIKTESSIEIENQEEKIEELVELKKEIEFEDYDGYKVIAILEIPKISLKTNILADYSREALNKCPTRYWGENPNEIGNFCIAGHNREKMFKDLIKLEIGDIIELTDSYNRKMKYSIYDVSKVLPENTECLSQKTNGNREITLITCTKDIKYRIIIKAREI